MPLIATQPEGPRKTLERILSKSGLGSRTEARSWIHEGRVEVNGRVVQNPDHWVSPEHDRILFEGRPLIAKTSRLSYCSISRPGTSPLTRIPKAVPRFTT